MNSAVETVIPETRTAGATSGQLASIGRNVSRVVTGIDAVTHWNESSDRLRRGLNVVIASLLLVICAPLMLLISLLIKLTSPGPVVYRQSRVGVDRRDPMNTSWNGRRRIDYGGRLFTIYKFRTMRPDPAATLQIWALPDDNRVTPLGRLLRMYRLDELPQLVNVLKGDMNIVGPRPEQPKIFMDLRQEIERYAERQRVLPGITGWAQINLKYDSSVEDVRRKVKFDLEYIQRRSAVQDLWILLRTVPVMLFRRGAW
jgi:lipopolysaccharide/colanic/teichoic acid biosynthesis glycosyltransferase